MSGANPRSAPDALAPADQILHLSYVNFLTFRAVYMVTKLGIPDLLKDGPLKSDELALATRSDPRTLYRLLRTVSCSGVLCEAPDRTFSLTPLGEVLRKDVPGSMWGLVIYCGEPFYLQAFEELAYSIRTGKPAFDKVLGASHFEYYEQNPEVGEIFDRCMTDWSNAEAVAIASACDLSRDRTVMDVGGGHGILLASILKVHPQVRGILFDQPHVVEGARSLMDAEGLLPRCEFVAGDFFNEVPSGSDVYVMKSILHDWEDEQSIAILKNCRRAMGSKGRLLLVETVVSPPGVSDFAKYQDLEMLVLLGGRERTIEEFESLLSRADLRLSRLVPTRKYHSIIEAAGA